LSDRFVILKRAFIDSLPVLMGYTAMGMAAGILLAGTIRGGKKNKVTEMIDEIAAEDPDFRAVVKVAAVPRTTYTGITITRPNIKEAWKIGEDHPFVKACAEGLRSIGEPVGYAYWDFGTDLGVVCGKYRIAGIGYSPMQEYYCHRPVDKCRIDFMERALVGNVAIFGELTKLGGSDFSLA